MVQKLQQEDVVKGDTKISGLYNIDQDRKLEEDQVWGRNGEFTFEFQI